MKSMTLAVNGGELDCVRFGRGGRPLVILPGLSFQRVKSAGLSLTWMYRSFGKEHTVYIFDKRTRIPDGFTLREMADDQAAAMEQLGLVDADVFGVSQGGMIAQYLAIGHPRRVRRLALGVTAARVNPVMEEGVGSWIAWAERGDYMAIVTDMMGEKMYSAAYVKKYHWLLPLLCKVGRPKDMSRFINMAKACLTCGTYEELHKITCPTLVLGGKEDRVVTGAASEEIAAALECGLHLYSGLGHAAYEEAPDFNQRIKEFFSQ